MSEQETKNRLPKSTRITSGGARFLGHPQLATIGLQSTRIARIQSGGGVVELVLKSETAMGGRAGRRMDGCSAHLATARPRTDGRTDGRRGIGDCGGGDKIRALHVLVDYAAAAA